VSEREGGREGWREGGREGGREGEKEIPGIALRSLLVIDSRSGFRV
jgi:hypothetical protein